MVYELPEVGQLGGWGTKVNDSIEAVKETADEALAATEEAASTAALDAHVEDTNNPHAVTKDQLGLENVDNTADSVKPISAAAQAALDAKANTTALKFLLIGNLPGGVAEGDIIEGGIPIPSNVTLDRILITVNVEPRGGNLVVVALKRDRETGVETSLGTMTITSNTGKRATLTGLAATFTTDDRLFFRVSAAGASQSSMGSGLQFTLADTATTFPTILTAPAAPTSLSAVASGDDVDIDWTAPASGVYYGVDIWKDAAFLVRVLKGTNTYLDVGAGDEDHDYELRAVNNDAVSSTASVSYSVGTAIGIPAEIGSGTSTATTNSVVTTLSAGAILGSKVITTLVATNPGVAFTWSVTDNRGNTYAVDTFAYDSAGPGAQAAIASTEVTTALQAGDTLTWTMSTGTVGRKAVKVLSVSGIANASAKDKTQTNVPAGSTRFLSTGATAALAQVDELAIAVFGNLSTSLPGTPGSNWSAASVVTTASGSNDRTNSTLWRIVNSTSALTGSLTLTLAAEYAGAIATYKGD